MRKREFRPGQRPFRPPRRFLAAGFAARFFGAVLRAGFFARFAAGLRELFFPAGRATALPPAGAAVFFRASLEAIRFSAPPALNHSIWFVLNV